ncbi:hypothetical protein H4W19_03790 [Pseudoxanthomonas mexicana]|uniref:Uncharacterized protein n=1 Tax=Pseudoxanthomonas mexicana TaxID=128785 RepID=A0ABX6RFA9_PSEMX|nr:hypothetical protein H4W19_03790 [Pseudoxanthomonas mexicana]
MLRQKAESLRAGALRARCACSPDLRADWLGWKQRGRYLVAPDGQRISPERMRGIMWRLDAEARPDAARVRNAKRKISQGPVKVVFVDLADWHASRFGSRAG